MFYILTGNVMALIDMGSNSIQLVIYKIENNGGHYHQIDRVKVSARLVNYLNTEGNLSKEGIQTILTTLREFLRVADSYHVRHLIVFATAVIRNSANQVEVLAEIEKQTGLSISVLSEYEEAYFGYLGIIQATDLQDGVTIDIGGGSTEITLYQNRELMEYHSFPFGAVNLTETFTKGEKATPIQLAQLQDYLLTQLQSLHWLNKARLPIIGIGGSARNLSRIHQAKSKSKTKQPTIHLRDINYILEELTLLNVNKRSKIKGLSKKRKDIIIPAIQTISLLMKVVEAPYFVFSHASVRDGVLYQRLKEGLI